MPERQFRRSPARAAAAASKAAATAAPAARKKSVSPTKKSPSQKSPGRTARRGGDKSQSPARRTKSPARRTEKSPSRVSRKPSPSRRKSPSRKPKSPPVKQSPSPDSLISLKQEILRDQPEVLLVNHERRDGFFMQQLMRDSREPSTSSSIIKRRSARITTHQAKIEEKYEESKGIEQLKVTEDTEVEYPEKPSKTENGQIKEFCGTFGALVFPILFQVALLVTHLYVSKALYGIKGFVIPLDWRTYFSLEVGALYLGFVVFQLVLSILPIGRLVDGLPGKLGKLQYRCNGFVSLILTGAIIGGLRYFKYPVTIIVDKYIQFIVTALIFGHILAMILYAKGSRSSIIAQNPFAVTGNKVYDFYMGREINPRIGPFDVKMGLLRISLIGLFVVNAAFILKSLDQSGGYSPTLLVAAGMQIWYALDALWFEQSLLASFGIMYEGTGQLFALHAVAYPFIPTIITRCILNYRWETCFYALGAIGLIHTIGYVIYRASNSQKSEFRKNPLNPALAHLETIPTSRGKKILASGWWGWVRHPNYLGDIIMEWCWAMSCGIAHPLPYIVPFFTTLLLVHRAKRDDGRCRLRYNAAWDRYCNRVKYHIMPKVF